MDKKILDLLTEQLTAKEVGIVKETFERKEFLEGEVEGLRDMVNTLNEQLKTATAENLQVSEGMVAMSQFENSVKKREQAVKIREDAILALEYKLDVTSAQKEAGVWREAMTMMLRPASTRRNYQQKITSFNNNGVQSYDTVSPATEEVIEE